MNELLTTGSCTRTCRGRVVYNRKKHLFKGKDLLRIAKKLYPKAVRYCAPDSEWAYLADVVWNWFHPDPYTSEGNSGEGSEASVAIMGDFGGGGASRDFGFPFQEMLEADIIVLYKCEILEER